MKAMQYDMKSAVTVLQATHISALNRHAEIQGRRQRQIFMTCTVETIGKEVTISQEWNIAFTRCNSGFS